MSNVTRGFFGRQRPTEPAGRVPPGQYLTSDFPVLSAGPTPHIELADWNLSVSGEVDSPAAWTWDEMLALPQRRVHRRHPLRHQVVEARHNLARRVGGHAAGRRRHCRRVRDGALLRRLHHQPAADRHAGRQGLGGLHLRRRAARSRARRAGAAGGAAPVLLEERQVGAGVWVDERGRAGILGGIGYHTTETHGRNSGTRATELADRVRGDGGHRGDRPTCARHVRLPGWPGHRAGPAR